MAENGNSSPAFPAPTGAEQRRHIREEIPLDVQFVLLDGTEVQGQIENISAGGAKIRAQADVEIGERIIVRVHEIGHFSAIVTRIADRDMAVEFKVRRERATRIADMLTCLLHGRSCTKENRMEVRTTGQFSSQIALDDGRIFPCQVIDFSRSGAAVAIDPMPRLGSSVQLGKTPARVVHTDDGVIGLTFETTKKTNQTEV